MVFVRITLNQFGKAECLVRHDWDNGGCQRDRLEGAMGKRRPQVCHNEGEAYIYHGASTSGVPMFDVRLCVSCMEEHVSENIVGWNAAWDFCISVLDGFYAPSRNHQYPNLTWLQETKQYCEEGGCLQLAEHYSPSGRLQGGLHKLCTRHAVKHILLPEYEPRLIHYLGEATMQQYRDLIHTAFPVTKPVVIVKRDFPHEHYLSGGGGAEAFAEEVITTPVLLYQYCPEYRELSDLGRMHASGRAVDQERVAYLQEFCRARGFIS